MGPDSVGARVTRSTEQFASVVRGLDRLPAAWRGGVLTVGNFDGVHVGHQEILRRARLRGRPVIVLTFDPHPIAVLRPGAAPPALTTPDERAERLLACGAGGVAVIETDAAFLARSAEEFVEQVVLGQFAPRAMVEGISFRFGHDRVGTMHTLAALLAGHGVVLETVEPVRLRLPDEPAECEISSSLVRRLISSGRVAAAAAALGRPHALSGRVVGGAGVGRTLGFPTINLDATGGLVPGDGVYGGVATIGARRCVAAISIGSRPTFGGAHRVVEAHLLDAGGELSGSAVRLAFHIRVRDQARFDSPAALAQQIAADVATIRGAVRAAPEAGAA